jgi:hypothetical protein
MSWADDLLEGAGSAAQSILNVVADVAGDVVVIGAKSIFTAVKSAVDGNEVEIVTVVTVCVLAMVGFNQVKTASLQVV